MERTSGRLTIQNQYVAHGDLQSGSCCLRFNQSSRDSSLKRKYMPWVYGSFAILFLKPSPHMPVHNKPNSTSSKSIYLAEHDTSIPQLILRHTCCH